jgi:hypothetical protein
MQGTVTGNGLPAINSAPVCSVECAVLECGVLECGVLECGVWNGNVECRSLT